MLLRVNANVARFLVVPVTLMFRFPDFVGFLIVVPIFALLILFRRAFGMFLASGMPSSLLKAPFLIFALPIHFRGLDCCFLPFRGLDRLLLFPIIFPPLPL